MAQMAQPWLSAKSPPLDRFTITHNVALLSLYARVLGKIRSRWRTLWGA